MTLRQLHNRLTAIEQLNGMQFSHLPCVRAFLATFDAQQFLSAADPCEIVENVSGFCSLSLHAKRVHEAIHEGDNV